MLINGSQVYKFINTIYRAEHFSSYFIGRVDKSGTVVIIVFDQQVGTGNFKQYKKDKKVIFPDQEE
jgi:hypothetical protein